MLYMLKNKNVIDFHSFWFFFNSSQIFKEITSLSFQVSWTHQFLTEVKNFWILRFFHQVFQILDEALGFLSKKDSLLKIIALAKKYFILVLIFPSLA